MQYNLKYILIGAVILMVVVGLGRNPITSMRESKNAWKEGMDPLDVAFEEKKKDSKTALGRITGGGFSNRYNNPVPYDNGMVRQRNTPPATPYKPTIPGGGAMGTPQQAPQNQTPSNSYYPPPPENTGGSRSNTIVPPRSEIKRPTSPELADGTKLSLDGSEAFTIDDEGKKKPLDDGNYKLYGGLYTLYVRNGRVVLENE